jgi:uncharacterized membrane protein
MFQDDLVARVHLSKHRLEALADGVFAIAVTLIVLEIKVPDLERHASTAAIMHALRPQLPALFAYLVTFMICGTFWFLHQMSFHWIARIDRPLVFINIGFLMFVSLMPFSTSMFAHFMGNPLGEMFYFGNAAMMAVFLNFHWNYSRRKGLMTEDDGAAMERKLFQQRVQILAAAFCITVVLTPFIPQYVGIAPAIVLIFQRRREKRILAASGVSA